MLSYSKPFISTTYCACDSNDWSWVLCYSEKYTIAGSVEIFLIAATGSEIDSLVCRILENYLHLAVHRKSHFKSGGELKEVIRILTNHYSLHTLNHAKKIDLENDWLDEFKLEKLTIKFKTLLYVYNRLKVDQLTC